MENSAQASIFWDKLSRKNEDMLVAEGMENFKRTIANNYFNWLAVNPRRWLFRTALTKWIASPDLIPFRTKLDEMVQFRKSADKLEFTTYQRNIYRLYVSMIWSIMTRFDALGIHRDLSEPESGNPFRVMLDEKIISQDLANSILECNTVYSLAPKGKKLRIAEIGAGYGRLAYVFKKTINCDYTIFDIEPALSVSRWYLDRTVGHDVVKIVPAKVISEYPDGYFDIVLSISTLPEMSKEQVNFYIQQFSRISSHLIFLKQWKKWKNPEDQTLLTEDSYNFGSTWERKFYDTDVINRKFFNAAWVKA